MTRDALNEDAFRDLYDRCAPAVFRRAYAFVGVEADAWDIVQQVFQKFFLADFRRAAEPMTYLHRATTNESINWLRSRKRRTSLAERAVHVTEQDQRWGVDAAGVEARNVLEALARRLDARSAQVAALYFVEGAGQEDIAEILGLSRKTIQRTLERLKLEAQALAEAPLGDRT